MKKLTKVEYWDTKYSTKKIKFAKLIQKISSMSLFYYDLVKILKSYVPKNSNVLEVGCAPAVRLINLSKDLKFHPYGIDYSPKGVDESKENFAKAGLDVKQVSKADFLDDNYIKENLNRFDVVMSYGFIEHFDNVKDIIERHNKILKKKGILLLSIPNLRNLNKIFTPRKILNKHNLDIMNLKSLKENVPDNIKIVCLKYYGGPFNVGAFFYENKILELIRKVLFIFQRIFLDNILILFYKCGLNLNNKYSSPAIIMVGIKNED